MTVSLPCIDIELPSLIPPSLPLPPPLQSSASPSTPPQLVSCSPSSSPLTPCGIFSLGSCSHLHCPSVGIPRLCLWLLIPSLHLGPSTCQLRLGSYHPRLHRVPSSLWLHLGLSSPCLRHRLARLSLNSVSPTLKFQWAPPWFSDTTSPSQSSGTLVPPRMLIAAAPPQC